MKFLIASSPVFLSHFTALGEELKNNNMDCKIVIENPYLSIKGYLQKRKKIKEFRELIKTYDPDFILSDSASDFGSVAISVKKPLIILLRGDFWIERKMHWKKMKKSLLRILNFWLVNKMAERCYKNSAMILPVCKYLQDVVQKRYHDKTTRVLHIGVDSSYWNGGKGMNLKHPCIGLIQRATIWEKTMEMLILPEILKKLPDVHFYWAGDGNHSEKIISALENYNNFHWLGNLEYPEKIRDLLSEIDIYALFSGLDMTPLSILEASLMRKPILATNIGGIPETIKNNETGLLVDKGDYHQWVNSIQNLLQNPEKTKSMGEQGRKFTLEEFNLEFMAKKLISYCDFVKKRN